MKKRDAEPMIGSAKARLIEVFPQYADLISNTPVYLLTSKNKAEKRNRIADELSAPMKYDLSDTAGEAIIGAERYAIIMYYPDIRDDQFTHFVYHEFGHVISFHASRELFDEAQNDLEQNRDTPVRSGQCVWSELIAETIAYRVEDSEPSADAWYAGKRIETWMDEAVNCGFFAPYAFSFYCAMFFEDPTICAYRECNPYAAIGANNCDDNIMPLIEATLKVIANQLSVEDYWIITRDQLVELGNQIDALWDYCASKQRSLAFEAFQKLI